MYIFILYDFAKNGKTLFTEKPYKNVAANLDNVLSMLCASDKISIRAGDSMRLIERNDDVYYVWMIDRNDLIAGQIPGWTESHAS